MKSTARKVKPANGANGEGHFLADGRPAVRAQAEKECQRLFGKSFTEVCRDLDEERIDSNTAAAHEIRSYRFLLE